VPLTLVVFIGVFAVLLLLVSAFHSMSSQETKTTLARLDALSSPAARRRDETVDIRRQELLSSLPWLNRFLQKVELTSSLRRLLSQADVDWTAGKLLLWAVFLGLLAAYFVFSRTGAVLLTLLVAALVGSLPFVYVLRKRARRFARFEELLPQAVDLMVGAIRAGHSFSSAMTQVSKECPEPIRREFRQCVDEQNFGLELRVALENLADRVPIPDVRLIVTAVLAQQESGGNITEILERVAQLIRERFRLERQIRVHTAQGRLTGWVLCLLPPVLGFLMYLMRPEHVSLLWQRDIGIKRLYAGAMMQIAGVLVIRRIIKMRI
jgi:tight adherence protein B